MQLHIKWFLHLASGKSAKNLPDLKFTWTKKMAHTFINSPDNINYMDAFVRSITKVHGGSENLYPYFCISKIKEGLVSQSYVQTQLKGGKTTTEYTAEFWNQFIEYFCKQGMYDPAHISHIADYVDNIKFDRLNAEKPNFDIRKKNLNTLINESEIWTDQLNRLARAAGMARRDTNTDNAKRQLQYLETSWAGSNWATGWKFKKTVKVGKTKHEMSFRMVELCSGYKLLEEGRAMNHCVFSYVGSCKSGKCRIFSLREELTNSRVLTIEVRGNTISQVRGKNNRSLTNDENVILEDWASNAGCNFFNYY